MTIFEKGNYKTVPSEFRTFGVASLEELSKFQEKFEIYDTDTSINAIRDAIIANYLDFDLLNFGKHGFDAKKSKIEHFLEVKQCSVSSETWGGTWNDTNEEKALAFSDDRLFTVVAVWKGASDLQFMVYGQNKELGELLLYKEQQRRKDRPNNKNIFISITQLIRDFGFEVICPIDKEYKYIIKLLVAYDRELSNFVDINSVSNQLKKQFILC